MAKFCTKPMIEITVDFDNVDLKIDFGRWFAETFHRHVRCDLGDYLNGRGYSGHLDVLDAEKVVAWLKAHGAEPRR